MTEKQFFWIMRKKRFLNLLRTWEPQLKSLSTSAEVGGGVKYTFAKIAICFVQGFSVFASIIFQNCNGDFLNFSVGDFSNFWRDSFMLDFKSDSWLVVLSHFLHKNHPIITKHKSVNSLNLSSKCKRINRLMFRYNRVIFMQWHS